jgi:hypothetical protein
VSNSATEVPVDVSDITDVKNASTSPQQARIGNAGTFDSKFEASDWGDEGPDALDRLPVPRTPQASLIVNELHIRRIAAVRGYLDLKEKRDRLNQQRQWRDLELLNYKITAEDVEKADQAAIEREVQAEKDRQTTYKHLLARAKKTQPDEPRAKPASVAMLIPTGANLAPASLRAVWMNDLMVQKRGEVEHLVQWTQEQKELYLLTMKETILRDFRHVVNPYRKDSRKGKLLEEKLAPLIKETKWSPNKPADSNLKSAKTSTKASKQEKKKLAKAE